MQHMPLLPRFTEKAHGHVGDVEATALQPGDPRMQLAYTMYVDHSWTVDELCATLHISRATCYRYVALARQAVPEE